LPRLFLLLRPFLELVIKLALCRARIRSIDGVLPFERGVIARKPYRSMRSRRLNHVPGECDKPLQGGIGIAARG
jgi:hypothetical protein